MVNFLSWLFTSRKELNSIDIKKRLDALGLDYICPPFLVATIEANMSCLDFSNRDKVLADLESIVLKNLKQAFSIINDEDNILVLVYNFSQPPDFEDLRKQLLLNVGIDCFIGVGSIVGEFDRIRSSASESQRMIGFKYQYQEKGIAYADSFIDFRYYSIANTNGFMDCIIDNFLAGDIANMSVCIDKLINYTRGIPNITKSSIRRTLIELTVRIVNLAAYANINVDKVIGDIDIYHWIMNQCHTETITEWILRISMVFIDNMKKNDISQKNRKIAKACIYIDKHLDDNGLSLSLLSEYIGLTPTYFSSLFKSVTGESVKSYITSRRIQRSMYLLEKTDLNIEDIAIQTGHSRIQYFTNTFKKHVGITPKQYRQNHKKSLKS